MVHQCEAYVNDGMTPTSEKIDYTLTVSIETRDVQALLTNDTLCTTGDDNDVLSGEDIDDHIYGER